MDDLPTNVENLSPSFYITICVLCSVTFDWLWLPRTFILLAMTFQLTRQESPWATKASLAGSTKMSLEVLGWQNVFKCLRGFYWMRLLTGVTPISSQVSSVWYMTSPRPWEFIALRFRRQHAWTLDALQLRNINQWSMYPASVQNSGHPCHPGQQPSSEE